MKPLHVEHLIEKGQTHASAISNPVKKELATVYGAHGSKSTIQVAM